MTGQEGAARSKEGAGSKEGQPKSQMVSPDRALNTQGYELSICKDPYFQLSLCLHAHGSLFSNVLPGLQVCLFWFCSSSKAWILCPSL